MKFPQIEFSNTIPLELGSPLRVPLYAWKNWNIDWATQGELDTLKNLSDIAYQVEWAFTDASRHLEIATAAQRAGLEDANRRLNSAVAKVVSNLIDGATNLVDVGAGGGGTTKEIIAALVKEQKQNLTITLVDPAKDALKYAQNFLGANREKGIIYRFLPAIDIHLSEILPPASQDFIVAVASLHHHADLLPPLMAFRKVLKPNGLLIIADWHNSMWEHPRRVFELLGSFNWRDRESDLRSFCDAYPIANTTTIQDIRVDEDVANANSQICEFWKQYASLASTQGERFLILEGHRPVGRYIDDLCTAGFELLSPERIGLEGNPFLLLPKSSLLCVTVGIRR